MTDSLDWQRVCVVLPAFNEADALPQALAGSPVGVRRIVVDNGSTDNSGMVAKALGAAVVPEPRKGFGSACKAGLDAAVDCEVIVYMDADATCDWSDLNALVTPILDDQCDLVLGRRVKSLREPGAMPFHVAIAVRLLGFAIARITGEQIHDVPPYRAVRTSSLRALDLQDRTYGWPLEMVIRASRAGLRIEERPVRYKVRVGTSKVTGTVMGTLAATNRMARVLWQLRR